MVLVVNLSLGYFDNKVFLTFNDLTNVCVISFALSIINYYTNVNPGVITVKGIWAICLKWKACINTLLMCFISVKLRRMFIAGSLLKYIFRTLLKDLYH